MDKLRPRNYQDTDTINVITNTDNDRVNVVNEDISEKDVVNARKNRMTSRLWKLHNSELRVNYFKLTINLTVFFATLILLVLQITDIMLPKISKTSYGWYILFGVPFLVSLVLWVKIAINISSIKSQIQDYRDENVDLSITPAFVGNSYIGAVRSNLITIWFVSWLNFYALVFLGIILWLNNGSWIIESKDTTFNLKIDWPEILQKGFGNVNTLIIIYIVALVVFDVLSIWRYIYNYKKIKMVESYAASNVVGYHEKANLKQLNRACFIISLLVLAIFLSLIVIPLFIIFRKRKKKI